jgi:plasmid stability protein
MTNLSIKNVPEELVARLRERAREHHRSLQQELMVILEEAVRPKTMSIDEVYERIKELGVQTDSESVAMVREDRDAR